jgi:hypothetical protein
MFILEGGILRCILILAQFEWIRGGFQIYQPDDQSSINLGADDSVLLLFTHTQLSNLPAGFTVKVDVMGFADPTGWPHTELKMGYHTGEEYPAAESPSLRGSVLVRGLVPGAVRIRVQLLTPDGTDAVGEDSRSLFLDPKRYLQITGMSGFESWSEKNAYVHS